MRRCVAIAMVIAACAPGPPERLAHIKKRSMPQRAYRLWWAATRPEIDVSPYLPDLHDELRWPLSLATHPMLEPHFSIARELAQPGIAWLDLCTGAVLNRHVVGTNANDLLEYLRGWCAAAAGDPDKALDHLVRVRGSVVIGLAAAFDLDVPFILGEQPVDKAELLLQKHQIHDAKIFDTLAATYVEIGRDDDARQINRIAIAYAKPTTEAAYCHRAAKELLLNGGTAEYEAAKLKQDATCEQLVHALECRFEFACLSYVLDQHRDSAEAYLLAAFLQWPSGAAPYDVWITTADKAARALPRDGAVELGVVALLAAIRSSTCSTAQLFTIRNLAVQFAVREHYNLSREDCENLARGSVSAPSQRGSR